MKTTTVETHCNHCFSDINKKTPIAFNSSWDFIRKEKPVNRVNGYKHLFISKIVCFLLKCGRPAVYLNGVDKSQFSFFFFFDAKRAKAL